MLGESEADRKGWHLASTEIPNSLAYQANHRIINQSFHEVCPEYLRTHGNSIQRLPALKCQLESNPVCHVWKWLPPVTTVAHKEFVGGLTLGPMANGDNVVLLPLWPLDLLDQVLPCCHPQWRQWDFRTLRLPVHYRDEHCLEYCRNPKISWSVVHKDHNIILRAPKPIPTTNPTDKQS